MKLYIAGPMTGLDELNYPAFEEAAKLLREAGYKVVSPHECIIEDKSWRGCMKVVLHEMINAEGIALLSNWQLSKGAKLEFNIAYELEMPAQSVQFWLNERENYVQK